MKVHLLLHRPEDHSDGLLPSVVGAIDEWTYDAGVEWVGDDLDAVRNKWGPGEIRQVTIELADDETLLNVFEPTKLDAAITATSNPNDS